MQPKLYLLIIFTICLVLAGWAQDGLSKIDKILHFPSSFFTKVNNKTSQNDAGRKIRTTRNVNDVKTLLLTMNGKKLQ